MASVTLRSVWKIYPGKVTAVRDFTLDIKDREFVVFLGPSGCGKTTTLRMIAGLEEVTKGEIYIDDKLVNDVHPKERDIAMVFQNYALYPHMTVYENLAFPLKLRKVPKPEIERRVKEAARILGIESLLNRKPKELSGGQRQRVAVGRAIVRKPKVYLFDEPLSNLDAKLRVQMRTELSKLHTRLQTTMIYVTHDQVEAMTLGDRIVVMRDGVIQQVDDPITIYHKPRNLFVAGFIGSPPMNFIDVRVVEKDGEIYLQEDAENPSFEVKVLPDQMKLLKEYKDKKVVFGIRPEDVYDKLYYPNPQPEHVIKAKVDVVEPLGSETYVYLNTGNNTIVARFESMAQVKVDQQVEVVLDMKKAHTFNKETELAIF